MEFLIADTFTSSLAKRPAQEQRAVKVVFDLQVEPSVPGLQFHRIERNRDSDSWSVRVNCDLYRNASRR
jgi:hypothetical protein